MGAKFTIVLDTDDPKGLRDALEIASLLNKNHGLSSSGGSRAEIGKIPLIKMIREVAKKVEEGKMDSSLRDCKRFVDGKWHTISIK